AYLVDAVRQEMEGKGHPNVSSICPEDFPRDINQVLQYYVRLLRSRKLLGVQEFDHFLQTHGREPKSDEIQRICQNVAGARGWRLAKKVLEERDRPLAMVDEELVLMAIFQAIQSGIPTIVLTRDNDVFE